jgi:hypothetical protein
LADARAFVQIRIIKIQHACIAIEETRQTASVGENLYLSGHLWQIVLGTTYRHESPRNKSGKDRTENKCNDDGPIVCHDIFLLEK